MYNHINCHRVDRNVLTLINSQVHDTVTPHENACMGLHIVILIIHHTCTAPWKYTYLPTTFTEILIFGFVPKPLNASHEYIPLCLLWMLKMVSTKLLTLTEGSLRLRPDPSTVNLTQILGGLPGS